MSVTLEEDLFNGRQAFAKFHLSTLSSNFAIESAKSSQEPIWMQRAEPFQRRSWQIPESRSHRHGRRTRLYNHSSLTMGQVRITKSLLSSDAIGHHRTSLHP